jgi:hypothetical protein
VCERSQGGHTDHIDQRYQILAILISKEHDEGLLSHGVRAINACLKIIDEVYVEVFKIVLSYEILGEAEDNTLLRVIIESLRTHHEVGKAARIQQTQKYIGFFNVPGAKR